MAAPPNVTSTDSLYEGAVTLSQPAKGYRVNVDALFLASFAATGRHAQFAVDLGAGVGAVALGLHHLGAANQIALVEREPELSALARANAIGAALEAEVYEHDLTLGLPAALARRADLVVSNPPFFSTARGRVGAPGLKARARFGALAPFLSAANSALRDSRARVAFIYPARDLSEFLATAERTQLVAKRVRFIHADVSSAARVALIELQRAKPGGLVVLPPLFEWTAPGQRSAEVRQILSGRPAIDRATAVGRK